METREWTVDKRLRLRVQLCCGWIPVLLLLFAAPAMANEEPLVRTYQMVNVGASTVTAGDKTLVMKTRTAIRYSFARTGKQDQLTIHDVETRITEGKKPKPAVVRMNRKALYINSGAMEKTVLRKMATPELRETLSWFDAPVCTFTLDANGKEIKRVPVATMPVTFHQYGFLDNSRVFHAPFRVSQKTWTADRRMPMGSGRYGKGTLTYTVLRTTTDGRLAAVQVSGSLKGKDFVGAEQIQIRNISYTVSGMQTYDLRRGCWTGGTLDLKAAFDSYFDEKKVASTESTTSLTLEEMKKAED